MAEHADSLGDIKLNQPKSLSVLAYEAIRHNIVNGIFKPGDWLRQDHLSSSLGVSATPIRQALERLIAEGVIERIPNRGVRVVQIDKDEIAEVYAIRLIIEPIIHHLATIYITDAEIDELKALVRKAENMVTLDEMVSRREINRQFHFMICDKCQHPTLGRIYKMIWNRIPFWALYEGYFKREALVQDKLDYEAKEHHDLLNVIASRDESQTEEFSNNMIRGFFKDELIEYYQIPEEILEKKELLLRTSSQIAIGK